MNRRKQNFKGGQVIIMITLLFFFLSSTLMLGVMMPATSAMKVAKNYQKSKSAFLMANSMYEETLYRLLNQLEIGSSESLSFAGGVVSADINSTSDGRSIIIEAEQNDFFKKMNIELLASDGVSFSYGLQTGQGGLVMSGSARINGSVYSNGDIIGSGSVSITGGATSANTSEAVANQTNGTTTTPSHAVSFGGNGIPQDVAQSFTVSTTTPISSVRFYIKRSNSAWMNGTTVRIVNNSSGKPGKITHAQGALDYNQVTTTYNYLTIPLSPQYALTPGTTYWIVLDTGTTWGTFYTLGATNATYANGIAKTGTWSSSNGGTWNDTSPAGLDIYFDMYVGGDLGIISDVDVGSSGVGDAWANTVNNSTVAGTIYCQAASGNNKSCNTSRADPVEQPFPVSDANIEAWKEEAESGGVIEGSVTYGGSTVSSIGPKRINGNLTVEGSAKLTINGKLYVTGNITVDGSGEVKLNPSYGQNSEIIVTDGRLIVGGSGIFKGSGTNGSYILLVSNSTCPTGAGCSGNPAVDLGGSAGTIIINAQKGTAEVEGSANLKQLTANKIIMSGSAIINYETGLADINFSGGPSGAWVQSSWSEVE